MFVFDILICWQKLKRNELALASHLLAQSKISQRQLKTQLATAAAKQQVIPPTLKLA